MIHLYLKALCFLALVISQVNGFTRGYLCECHGELLLTHRDHCHHPEFQSDAVSSLESCHHDSEENTEEHIPAKEPLLLSQLQLIHIDRPNWIESDITLVFLNILKKYITEKHYTINLSLNQFQYHSPNLTKTRIPLLL
jgi:hypothetical protein